MRGLPFERASNPWQGAHVELHRLPRRTPEVREQHGECLLHLSYSGKRGSEFSRRKARLHRMSQDTRVRENRCPLLRILSCEGGQTRRIASWSRGVLQLSLFGPHPDARKILQFVSRERGFGQSRSHRVRYMPHDPRRKTGARSFVHELPRDEEARRPSSRDEGGGTCPRQLQELPRGARPFSRRSRNVHKLSQEPANAPA